MTVMRSCLAVVLVAGCTKSAPPPQPPADDSPPLETADEPEPEEEEIEIDSSVAIEGPLTEAQVDEVVKAHFNEIQACFDAALVRMESDNLTGAISVRIEVDASGAVTSAQLEASNFDDPDTPACIVGEVDGWSFPKGKKASTVVYPFFLRSY